MIKKFFWIGCLAFGLQTSWAFSLLGPVANGPDAWQVNAIGYNPLTWDELPSGPKNLGEEYRRNTPVMYYACDASFLDYFGSNGVVAINNAFAIMNALTNVDSYNYTNSGSEISDTNFASTNQFPLNSTENNPTAGALGLLDLKSVMLHAVIEQMGLADPVRYVWALHDRFPIPGNTNPCPGGIEYLMVQRNFDPITWRPSAFVDNELYTYKIEELCTATVPPPTYALPITVNPAPALPVAASGVFYGLNEGQYYTNLTWDDVGGLRYLLSSNNINTESPPAGTLVFSTNLNAEIQITTSNLITLTLAALTNDQAALQALFPNLVITSVTTNPDGTFTYTFGNVITNSFTTNTTVEILTTNIAPAIGAPVGSPNVTNTTVTSFKTNLVSGDYFIFPSSSCGFEIVKTISSHVTATTNLLVVGTNSAGHFFSQSLVDTFTNHVLLAAPCSSSVGGTALYQGVERIQFVQANFDSLLGQFFQPVTNLYNMVAVTNSQTVAQSLQRVVTQPDLIIAAADLESGPAAQPEVPSFTRNVNFDQANIYPGLAGPGTITPSSTITFDKVGPTILQGAVIDTNSFITGPLPDSNTGIYLQFFVWGSFGLSINFSDIVVYPNSTDIQNLENEVLVQVSPTSLPDGTNGVAYPATPFTANGGSFTSPFTWSATGLPSGLTLSSGGTLSGTPTQSGTFDPVIQLTDYVQRSVQWNYVITIH
jgi:hypothetical protein